MPAFLKSFSIIEELFQKPLLKFFLVAGIATLVDVTFYYFIINYIIDKSPIYFNDFYLDAHEFTLIISYSTGVIINFMITKNAVFNESDLKTRKQFIRFYSIAVVGFFANYSLLRFFVEVLGFWPTIGRITSALSLGLASYYIHKFFTFKISKND